MNWRVHFTSFRQVYNAAIAGTFSNEAELRQAFVEALKAELEQHCRHHQYIAENMLAPALDEALKRGRPDIRVSNLVIEVERPGAGLDIGRQQLTRYMSELYEKVRGKVKVYGLVTDGVSAEIWVLDSNGERQEKSGNLPDVASNLLSEFCSSKIPVTDPEDLIRLFGV